MFHRNKIKKNGFRLLESSELALIAGGDAPPNPAIPDPNSPPGFGEALMPFITEDGQIISDNLFGILTWGGDGDGGSGGNVIIVTGDRESDSSSGSGSSSSGAPSPQGYDIYDPTSDIFHTLNMIFAQEIAPGLFDYDGDGQGDMILVTASPEHTVTDGNSTSDDSLDVYACIGGGEGLVGGVCATTGAFDLYFYGGVGLSAYPIDGVLGLTADGDELLTGPSLELTGINGALIPLGSDNPDLVGAHVGVPGVALTYGVSLSDLLASLREGLEQAADNVEQVIDEGLDELGEDIGAPPPDGQPLDPDTHPF